MLVQPPEKTIEDYREAYKAATDKDAIMWYRAGWFSLRRMGGYTQKAREFKILEMTDVLRKRAQLREGS